jgi:ABC-2 type transport system ATP-binding protein
MSAADGSATVDAVVLDGASKQFNGHLAVENVSLTVPRGSIVGVIGPSGAGKTTTVRLLTGALAPTAGTVRVLDQDPRGFSRAVRERIGYMPQLFTLYPDLTAAENVDFVASLFGMLWPNRRRRVREVLELVELWEARGRKASDLSGGMQRRLELASALVHDPDLLFLDEPTAGIDPLLRVRIWEELHRLKDAGRTLLVTTQYVTEAEECDRVALIANGRLVAFDTPETLRRDALNGDVVEVVTQSPFDSIRLESLDQVRAIEQVDTTTFRVRVEDAGAATPLVVDAIGDAGGEVVSARELRPSFDDVFAVLVEREHERQAAADAAAEAGAAASQSGSEAA